MNFLYALKECFLISETMWIGLFIVLVKKVRVFELQLLLLNCLLAKTCFSTYEYNSLKPRL